MPSGVADHCRSCRSEYLRRWREQNPEHVAAHNAERRAGSTGSARLQPRMSASSASSDKIENVVEVVGCRTDRTTKGGEARHPQAG